MFTLYEIINYSFVIIVIEFSFLLKNVIKRMGEEDKERFLESFHFLSIMQLSAILSQGRLRRND